MLGNRAKNKEYRVGGTRGGRDQFKWDDVKTDKHRENYLGHSVMAPTGRWLNGKDIDWYAKSKSTSDAADTALEDEKRRIREADEDLINEKLGIKVHRKVHSVVTETSNTSNDSNKHTLPQHQLEDMEIKKLLSRTNSNSSSFDETVERTKGIGASSKNSSATMKQSNNSDYGSSNKRKHDITADQWNKNDYDSDASSTRSSSSSSSSSSDRHRKKSKHKKSKHKKSKHKKSKHKKEKKHNKSKENKE